MTPEVTVEDLRDAWPLLGAEERVAGFLGLSRVEAREFFRGLSARGRAQILTGCPAEERELWLRLLEPDDVADVLQEMEPEERPVFLALLDQPTLREVTALLAYAEDQAGGLMSPRYVRVRPGMSVEEAIRYVRRQASERAVETIHYAYALDSDQKLQGVVSFRELLVADGKRLVLDVMRRDPIVVTEDQDDESVARVVAHHDLVAVPVVDGEGRMKGIVTVDDVVDVVQREATEDIQKLGGMEALDIPYLQTRFLPMLRKRAGWLAILFLGETLTASAMARFEGAIAQAVVLALFLPLIISSGGNSGSQAATLVIRAMALNEVRLRDWWRVVRREIAAGLALGSILGTIGLLRIFVWHQAFGTYGDDATLLALTLSISLIGVVTLGTIAGSMLPFLLRRLGLDPASASAPFVATLVDVSGVMIYFGCASLLMGA